MDSQKFFDKLGISPNWCIKDHPNCMKTIYTDEGGMGLWVLFSLSGRNDRHIQDRNIAVASPNMLLRLVKNTCELENLKFNTDSELVLSIINVIIDENIKEIENATNENWGVIRDLYEKCNRVL